MIVAAVAEASLIVTDHEKHFATLEVLIPLRR